MHLANFQEQWFQTATRKGFAKKIERIKTANGTVLRARLFRERHNKRITHGLVVVRKRK